MGRGGSFTATASGYNSFFYNPAGFARGGELTLASVNLWGFADRELISLAQEIAEGDISTSRSLSDGDGSRAFDPEDYEDIAEDLGGLQEWIENEDPAVIESIVQDAAEDTGITYESGDDIADIIASAGPEDIVGFLEALDEEAQAQSASYPAGVIDNIISEIESALPGGYLRLGAQVGLGYVGNGIGLGLFANAEATLDGSNLLEARGTAYNTITFVGGLGLTFGSLNVGVAVRPTIYGHTRVDAAPLLISYMTAGAPDPATLFRNTVYYGSGLGVDVGALWELGPFNVGLAVRDLLGTAIDYRTSDLETYYEALLAASLPTGRPLNADEASQARPIPMKVNAGVEFHPDLGVLSYIVDPSISVDLLDMTSAIRTWQAGDQVSADQVLSMLNIGGEVKLLRFLSLRGGYYGGYLSGGVGLDLFFIDLNAAIAGDFRRDNSGRWGFDNIGGSLELAIRF
ncbi:MAG: conjugal transfer protein TraF [Spirochaetota bacterium]